MTSPYSIPGIGYSLSTKQSKQSNKNKQKQYSTHYALPFPVFQLGPLAPVNGPVPGLSACGVSVPFW